MILTGRPSKRLPVLVEKLYFDPPLVAHTQPPPLGSLIFCSLPTSIIQLEVIY